MTETEFRNIPPVWKRFADAEIQERGCTYREFTEADLEELKAKVGRTAALIGKRAEEIKLREGEAEEEEKRKALVAAFERTVPFRYRDADIHADFDSSSPLIRNLAAGQSGVLGGANGIGKTRLAWGLGRFWKSRDPKSSVQIVKGAALLSEVKAVDGDWYRYIREEYGQSEHLIIDEIDKIKGSEADWMLLTYLIDHRYEWSRQTIIIGNCNREEAVSLIGQSSYSRLAGDGAEAYHLNGRDRRKEG